LTLEIGFPSNTIELRTYWTLSRPLTCVYFQILFAYVCFAASGNWGQGFWIYFEFCGHSFIQFFSTWNSVYNWIYGHDWNSISALTRPVWKWFYVERAAGCPGCAQTCWSNANDTQTGAALAYKSKRKRIAARTGIPMSTNGTSCASVSVWVCVCWQDCRLRTHTMADGGYGYPLVAVCATEVAEKCVAYLAGCCASVCEWVGGSPEFRAHMRDCLLKRPPNSHTPHIRRAIADPLG